MPAPAYKKGQVLRQTANWADLYFYQKSDTLYQLTVLFCRRFLPAHGDRTVDQMVQAARSGKQNIVEGSEAGMTSTETELKLLNVARASLHELREDYRDYLASHSLRLWDSHHPRSAAMRTFCHEHNAFGSYADIAEKMSDEELANLCLTLCHQADIMMVHYLEGLERRFVTEGGIKERMHKARTGYREAQDARLSDLEAENNMLKQQLQQARQEIASLKEALEETKRTQETQGNHRKP